MPAALRNKLGPEASEGLIEMFAVREQAQEQRIVHVFRDTLDLRFRVAGEEMRTAIRESELRTIERIHEREEKINTKIDGLRKETHTGFLNIQKQITHQTRWLITVAAFLALALKVVDLVLG